MTLKAGVDKTTNLRPILCIFQGFQRKTAVSKVHVMSEVTEANHKLALPTCTSCYSYAKPTLTYNQNANSRPLLAIRQNAGLRLF